MALNLEKQLLFYGAYHHNPVNVGIHITCVPLILMTSLAMATNSPDVPLPSWLSIPNLPLNLGTASAFLYATLYVLMEPVAGGLLAPLIMAGTAAGYYLIDTYGATANYIALGTFTCAWIAQFIGHGKFEGRAPALLDNLVQALFLAPFFVWFEVLFFFGYRPELKKRMNNAVEQEIKKFRNSKGRANSVNGHANGATKEF